MKRGTKLPVTVWIYTGISGAGIFIFAAAMRMNEKAVKKKEGEHESDPEETNCQ